MNTNNNKAMTLKPQEFIQYVKIERGTKKGQSRGVVVAKINENGNINLGWSYASITKGDQFNKEFGLNLARSRAEKADRKNALKNIPESVSPVLDFVRYRAEEYVYKNTTGKKTIVPTTLTVVQ